MQSHKDRQRSGTSFIEEKADRAETVKPGREGSGVIFSMCINTTLFSYEGGQTLEQVACRGSRVSICGDTQNPTRHSPEHPALVDPA